MTLYCATGNPGKLAEFRAASSNIRALPGLERIAPPPEDGLTFEQNAIEKALYYSRFTAERVFADDSGLEVEALAGAPGVRSARWAGEHATAEQNNALLLERLANVANRRAQFVCVIALAQHGSVIRAFEAEVTGEILRAPRGAGGFGYDPLFFYGPLNRTFAELTPQEKLTVDHRGIALRKMLNSLKLL